MIYCSKCGTPNEDTAKYCMNCGEKLSSKMPGSSSNSDSQPIVKESKKKKKKGCLSFFLIFMFIGFVISKCGNNSSETPLDTSSATSTTSYSTEISTATLESSTQALSEKDLFINALLTNPDVTQEAASSTYDLLIKMGFEDISSPQNISGTIFEVNADNLTLTITVSDKPYRILCGDYNLYENDSVKLTKADIENHRIDSADTTYYYTITQEIVSQYLKDPTNASFGSLSDTQMARNNPYVAVKGYVDATNSFGAVVRSNFVVEFEVIDLKNFSYNTIYVNIDGESSGKYIDLK